MASENTRPKQGYRLPKNQEDRRVEVVIKTSIIDYTANEMLQRLLQAFEAIKATNSEAMLDISVAINDIATVRSLSSEIRNIMIAMQYGPERPTDKE